MRTRWTTKARYTALGRDGFVRMSRVAEWFQEAAVCASTAGGFPPSRYEAMGASWFVRELEIAIDRPVRYDEQITVETWVSDLRRFRTHREYRVFDAAEEIVARGRVDWLLLEMDPTTRKVRPRVPDEEMRTSFPLVDEVALITDLPLEVPADPPAFEQRRSVGASELDWHDHVNHTAYVAWLEDLGVPLQHAKLRYEKDARPDNTLTVQGWTRPEGSIIQVLRDRARILVAATRGPRSARCEME